MALLSGSITSTPPPSSLRLERLAGCKEPKDQYSLAYPRCPLQLYGVLEQLQLGGAMLR